MVFTQILFIIIIFIFTVIVIISINNKFVLKNKTINPCIEQLTDTEYIKHMIPHHEVAVYMSEKHLHNTRNPIMFKILRNILRIQKYEINMMKDSMINNDYTDDMSDKNIKMNKLYHETQGDYTTPNKIEISNTFCDPSFFTVTKHLHHMTDESYIKHMIPHHQVAVDMSKRILKTSTNDFIIYLAYRIIRAQQTEISELYNLEKSEFIYDSLIL